MLVLVTVELCCAVLVFLLRVSVCWRSVFRKHFEIDVWCMCSVIYLVNGLLKLVVHSSSVKDKREQNSVKLK